MLPYGRKNPLPFPFSQRSHVGNLRQTIQGKGVIHKRVETAGVYPLVRPRGVSADSARFASAPLPMSTIIKIDKYPQKGYTNLTRGYGGIGRRARFRFWCPRRAGSSPVTRTSKKKRCGISPQRFSFADFYLDSLLCAFCSKRSLATMARWCVPSPIRPASSYAATLKVSILPFGAI